METTILTYYRNIKINRRKRKMNIEIEHVSKIYPGGKQALCDVSLSLNSPNLIGLLGPNGAGKSTLMKLLVSELLQSEGTIKVDGVPLEKKQKEVRKSLGYLPQTFGLYEELRIWQFLDYIAALKEISNSKQEVEKVLEMTNLTAIRKTKIRNLSGGQRQRVGIAQALLGNPEFLIFDEPTVGLDPEERINFRNLFSKTAQNRLVLLSTHIIEDIQSVCNQLIVMNQGSILYVGTPEGLIKEARGHVGVTREAVDEEKNADYQITSRINTADGIQRRLVANELPAFAEEVEPTLEDAYMFKIMQEVTE